MSIPGIFASQTFINAIKAWGTPGNKKGEGRLLGGRSLRSCFDFNCHYASAVTNLVLTATILKFFV